MNLFRELEIRAHQGRPIKTLMIGCGKFATMFLAQANRTIGIEIAGICDLDPQKVKTNLLSCGWDEDAISAIGIDSDAEHMIATLPVEVVVDATGDPVAGTRHALAAIKHGRHLVMVNVEADVLCGPALANRARSAGLVYSMAYGDQPALIAEQVDWARTIGFDVVAAGKGTKHRPSFHYSTPDTVWDHFGLTAEHAAASGMNSKMFNSFIDGTKSSLEMAAVANATGLGVPSNGLAFPAVGTSKLAHALRPASIGGVLERSGIVEVVSSQDKQDKEIADHLRWGVYVVFEAATSYVERCLSDYGFEVDETGRYAALWRPYHLIGLELGVSVANASIRGEATGNTRSWRGDVVACAKHDLEPGTTLDGEGGFCAYGKLQPASISVAQQLLPIGLAQNIRVTRRVAKDRLLTLADVDLSSNEPALQLRQEVMPDQT